LSLSITNWPIAAAFISFSGRSWSLASISSMISSSLLTAIGRF
jgi:hypothetical protein